MKNNSLIPEYLNINLNQNIDIYQSPNIFTFQQLNESFLPEIYNEPFNNHDNNQDIDQDNNPAVNINEKKSTTNGNSNDKNVQNELIINKNRLTINLEELKQNKSNIQDEKAKTKLNINKKKEKTKPGRKRKRQRSSGKKENKSETKTEHNKYSDDNLRRKCKHYILKYLLEFINKQIKEIYEGNIGNGIFKKELQTLNQTQKFNATINFNKDFLKKKICDIYSVDISGRFTTYPPYHNKSLIKNLMNEKDEKKRKFFKKLFNLNFIDCLKHFRGEVIIDELKGLKCLNDIKNIIIESYDKDGWEYFETLKYYFNNYEMIISKKKSRNRKKNDK